MKWRYEKQEYDVLIISERAKNQMSRYELSNIELVDGVEVIDPCFFSWIKTRSVEEVKTLKKFAQILYQELKDATVRVHSVLKRNEFDFVLVDFESFDVAKRDAHFERLMKC